MSDVRIAILGAAGRMGRMLVAAAAKTDGIKLVAAVEIASCPLIGKDSGVVAGIESTGIAISTIDEMSDVDVVVDFTFHTAIPSNIAMAKKVGLKGYVLATTGLTDEEMSSVRDLADSVPVVHSSNMSLGVNVLLDLVRRAAALLDTSYDIELVEMHHRHKKDAPSGTAIALAEAAAKGREVKLGDVAIYGREGISGERPVGEIALHALRGGEVVGDHTVIFAGEFERVEISHKAASRASFAKGALLAAKWVYGKRSGIYSMRDVLGLE